jgi:hypothetical protein
MRFRDENGWWLVDHDPRMKRTVWAMENGDGTTTYRTDYAVDDTIEANTAMRNAADAGWKGDWHKVASIPAGVFWDKLAEASKQGDDKYIQRFLNDSDNRAWRTKDGAI